MSNNGPGSYSVSVRSFFNYLKKNENKPVEIDKKKKKVLKPIINPIFEECSNLTEDNFWKSTFMECARGKFPRGFIFKNNLITYRKANKNTRLEISDSPREVYLATIDFFQRIGGIMSNQDRKRLQELEDEKLLEKQQEESEITWKEITSEKIKDIVISEFIMDICENMNFNEAEKKELTTTIKKGFMLKYFTYSNIIMSEGKITEIDGLVYDEKTQQYEIDSSVITRRPGRKITGLGVEISDKKPDVDFLDIWVKYLENLENKRNKKTHNFSSSYSHINNESEQSSSKNVL